MTTESKHPSALLAKVAPYALAAICFLIVALAVPAGTAPEGPILLLPALLLLALIFMTKRMVEAFLIANLLLAFMGTGTALDAVYGFLDGVLGAITGDTFTWILMFSLAVGSLTTLINLSGSGQALSEFLSKHLKSKRAALVGSWFIGAAIFVDDFLHCMLMGPTMMPIAKEKGISKEMLTYVLKCTGICFGMLIPVSFWGLLTQEALVETGVTTADGVLGFFIQLIPLNFFAWISVAVSLLVALGIIPLFGPMKNAEVKAENGEFSEGTEEEEEAVTPRKKPRLINVLLPIAVLVGFMILLDFDSSTASFIALLFTIVLYVAQGLLTPEECEEGVLSGGIKEMAFLYVVIALSLTFATGLEAIGFVDYVVSLISAINLPPQLLPVLLFVAFSASEFAVGLSSSLLFIALPMMAPLAAATGANLLLCVAAVISAVMVGVNCSFVSDMTMLSCAFTNTKPVDHTMANLPYQAIPFALSVVCFAVAGFVLA